MNQKQLAGAFWAGLAVVGFTFSAGAHAADIDKLVAGCADCHGKAGVSTEKDVPIIAGYSAQVLETNLQNYQSKERNCSETKFRAGAHKGEKTDMCKLVKDFSADDMKAVAAYFSEQKFVRVKQTFDASLVKKGKALHDDNCEKCHSEGGTSSDDDAGILAGQWTPYLRQACEEFKAGKRPIPKKMKSKLELIDKAGMEALLHYYASVK